MTEPSPIRAEREQFLQLLMPNERRLFAFIVSVLPNFNDAEDVLQETCLLMWEKFDQFEPGSNFLAWGCRIAELKVLQYFEKQARSKFRFGDQTVGLLSAEAVRAAPELEMRHRALAQCLERLSPKDRELIDRRYADHATVVSVSQQVGRSVHAIYKALQRIHESLLNCVRRTLAEESRQ